MLSLDSSDMKALISFLMFVVCSLCCYSQSSVTGAQQTVAAQRATFNDIISIGELIKVDTTLHLEDRLADIAFGSVSASLYCTYTVQVTAILGDMGDFFANKKFGEISL